MHAPPHFREDDPAILRAVMREHSFATLVSLDNGALTATHLPMLLYEEQGAHGTLVGHVARANPQWRAFGGNEVLVIFQGPHAYVSPSWYEDRTANVPTWNYVAVHAYGIPRLIDDDTAVARLLAATAGAYEAAQPVPWSPEEFDAGKYAAMRRGVVAFEIPISRVEGKRKLSQNKSAADRAGVVSALAAGESETGRAMAALMAQQIEEPLR